MIIGVARGARGTIPLSIKTNPIWPPLSNKEYPQNYRSLGMLVEEVLRSGVQIQGVTSFVRIVELLEARAGRNRTTKTWTDNLVKTVFIMMNFSRGGHEGDWVLRVLAAEPMLHYFRSAGCHNYARYRPLSRRLDRCDRVIQKESGDPNGGNMCSVSGATGTSRVRHNAHYVPYAQIRFDL